MRPAVRNWQQYWNYVMAAHRQTVPLVFCSVFVRDCIGRGACMDDGGAVLNQTPTTLSSGLVNVANSLAAIRRLCFEDGACSFDELRAAVAAQLGRARELLRRRRWTRPSGATTTTTWTAIFLDLFDDYCAWVRGQENYLGGPYDPSMLAISTPVPFGKACAAHPDGRLAASRSPTG